MVKVTPGGIYDFMKKAAQETGVVPTAREIADHFGRKASRRHPLPSASLQKQGLVQKQGRRWRLRDSGGLQEIPFMEVSLLVLLKRPSKRRRARCGWDLRALGIATKEPLFLRVRGDSMEGARIFDGDLALLERTEPHPGQIVAALIDGESTLKTYVARRECRICGRKIRNIPISFPPVNCKSRACCVSSLRQP